MLFGHLPLPVPTDWDHNSGIPSRMSNPLLLTESHTEDKFSSITIKNCLQLLASSICWEVFSEPSYSGMVVMQDRYHPRSVKPNVLINWIP